MFRFVSSWYDTGSSLSRVNPWICTEESMIFDDTVSAVRMFLSAGRETELICLGYAPQLRSFLQRQDLQEVPYWSAFDELQAVTWTAPGILHWQELDWPAGAACVDCGDCLEILVGEALFARVILTRDGVIREVDYYRAPATATAQDDPGRLGKSPVCRRDLYDDRGFCSSRIFYEPCAAKGDAKAGRQPVSRPMRQEYYSPLGELRMTQDLTDGSVLVAVDGGQGTRRCRSMEALIRERLRERFWPCPGEDAVVIAADGRHDELVMNAVSGQRLVFSFFRDRFNLGDLDHNLQSRRTIWYYADLAAMLIVDTETAGKNILDCLTKQRQERLTILTIPPYDARIAFGESEYLPKSGILLPVDQLEESGKGGNRNFTSAFQTALSSIVRYMLRHPEVRVLLGTERPQRELAGFARQVDGMLAQRLKELGNNCVNKINQERWDRKKKLEGEAAAREPLTEREAEEVRQTYSDLKKRFCLISIRTDEDLIRVMGEVRLLIDLRDRPDTRLQMAAISAGIPQAAFADSFCVEHTRNGYHLENAAAVEEVMPYYLLTLGNWKSAQLCCARRLSAYTDGTLVRQWEEGLEHYADSARGEWFLDVYEERGRSRAWEKMDSAQAGDRSPVAGEEPEAALSAYPVLRNVVILDGSPGSMAVLPVSCAGLSAGFRERILEGRGESAAWNGTRSIELQLRGKMTADRPASAGRGAAVPPAEGSPHQNEETAAAGKVDHAESDGTSFLPVIEWQNRLAVTGKCRLSFWPVYEKSGDVSLRFRLVRQEPDGGTRMDLLGEEELALPGPLGDVQPGTTFFCLLEAAGCGTLKMGDLRFRREGVQSERSLENELKKIHELQKLSGNRKEQEIQKDGEKQKVQKGHKGKKGQKKQEGQKEQKGQKDQKNPAGAGAADRVVLRAAKTKGKDSEERIVFPQTADRLSTPQREEILYSAAHKKERKNRKNEKLLQVFFTGGSQEQIRMAQKLLQRMDVSQALVLADPRFGGAGVFLGRREDDAYEQAVLDLIRQHISFFGLEERNAVFAGLDCGAAAALYYGARLHPAAIVLGRPVINLGSAALNEKIIRPAEFPESLDILAELGPQTQESSFGSGEKTAGAARVRESAAVRRAEGLNLRLWNRLEQEKKGLADTEVLFVGLQQDDYDGSARADLARFCLDAGIRLNVIELPGRHHDNEQELLLWMENRYRGIIRRCCANKRG